MSIAVLGYTLLMSTQVIFMPCDDPTPQHTQEVRKAQSTAYELQSACDNAYQMTLEQRLNDALLGEDPHWRNMLLCATVWSWILTLAGW